jgi:hypothetical protein
MKGIKMPTTGTLFDFYIDPETHKWEPWTKRVQKFEYDPDIPLQVSWCSLLFALLHIVLRNLLRESTTIIHTD